MGIKGLSSRLQASTSEVHISEWKHQTLAIDGHGWLHRGAVGCARELAEGEPTTRFAQYVVNRVLLLMGHGVECIVVFDGEETPAKSATHLARAKKREAALSAARAAEPEAAEKLYAQTVKVTRAMVHTTVRAVEDAGGQCMVAPFEADPQLAALCATGRAHGVVSEDSDLFAYLAACELEHCALISKLDSSGYGRCVRPSPDLFGAPGKFERAVRVFLRLGAAGARMVVQACVLAGCDYADAAQGVGIVTAFDDVLMNRNVVDHDDRLARVARTCAPGDADFLATARRAEAAFYHARVWNDNVDVPLCSLLSDAHAPKPFDGLQNVVGQSQDYARLNPPRPVNNVVSSKKRPTTSDTTTKRKRRKSSDSKRCCSGILRYLRPRSDTDNPPRVSAASAAPPADARVAVDGDKHRRRRS